MPLPLPRAVAKRRKPLGRMNRPSATNRRAPAEPGIFDAEASTRCGQMTLPICGQSGVELCHPVHLVPPRDSDERGRARSTSATGLADRSTEQLRRAHIRVTYLARDGERGGDQSAASGTARPHHAGALRAGVRQLVLAVLEEPLHVTARHAERDPMPQRAPPLLLDPVALRLRHDAISPARTRARPDCAQARRGALPRGVRCRSETPTLVTACHRLFRHRRVEPIQCSRHATGETNWQSGKRSPSARFRK
jgi:hypothetical protein